MIIEVAQKHIDNGKRHNCKFCAVALAMHDAGFPEAEIGINQGWLHPYSFSGGTFNLPEEVKEFIMRFDTYQPVSPLSFEVDLDV